MQQTDSLNVITMNVIYNHKEMSVQKASSKCVYEYLILINEQIETVKTPNVVNYLNGDLSNMELTDVFKRPFQVCRSTHFQEFQFKFLHNI